MLAYGNCTRLAIPRMESLPESSKPFDQPLKDDFIKGDLVKGDLVKSDLMNVDRKLSDRKLSLANQNSEQVTKAQVNTVSPQLQPDLNPNDRFTWADLGIVLSIPLVGSLITLGLIYLHNPLSISWLASSESPTFYSNSLWNLPKSIPQIQAELGRSQLKLGQNYNLKTGEIIYTVLEKETQNIREIRLYQTIRDRGEEKLLLMTTTTIAGIDEYFVRSPKFKYAPEGIPERIRPDRNRLPLKKFALLDDAPNPNYIWFTTSGTVDGIAYGQIYYFVTDKRSQLVELNAWTSTTAELPIWRNALASNSSSKQLVINQTQSFEPMYLVYQLEEVMTNSGNKAQLRQVNLNEAKNQPKSYQDALVMASVGLWSPALGKFNLMVEELKSQGKTLSPFLQEQYDFIALHAKITANRANSPNSNLGEKALINIIDGRWTEALAIANDPAYKGDRIAEMLSKYHPNIWQRVTTMLTFTDAKEVKLWGGLVVLHRNGLRRAEHWLRSQKVDPKDSDQLLQRLDLAPLSLNPQQLLGTVAYIGKGNPSAEWFLPPPKLESNQAWYEVSIDLIKDGNQWRSDPFRELSDRSSILLWRVLGFSVNSNLGVILYDNYGKSQAVTLTAQSLWVSDDGSLKILASGEASLAPLLRKSIIPPLVTSSGTFNPPNGTPIDWRSLSPKTIERIIRSMYSELQRNGQVSLSLEDFSLLVQDQWTLSEVNLDGVGKSEYLLLIEREQVDLGDRHYPLAIAFANDGSLIFSDMNGSRVWIDVLPSNPEGQILTLRNGRYEIWNFR